VYCVCSIIRGTGAVFAASAYSAFLYVHTLLLLSHNIVLLSRCGQHPCKQRTCTVALVHSAATDCLSCTYAVPLWLYCSVVAATGTVTLSLTPPPQQQHNSRSSLTNSSSSSSEHTCIQLYLRILHNTMYNSSSADAAPTDTTVSETAVATVTSAMALQPGPGLQGVCLEHKRVSLADTISALSNSAVQQVSV
jgi:hypothetical protein